MRNIFQYFLVATYFVTGSAFSQTEQDCQNILKNQNWRTLTAEKFCSVNQSRAKQITNRQFEKCFASARPMIAMQNLPATFLALCFEGGKNFNLSDLDLSCLKTYASIMSEDYLALDDIAHQQNDSSGYNSIAEEIHRQCKAGPPPRVNDSSAFQIIGRTAFHSLESVHNTSYPLGGLSGISKVSKNTYVTVSDDRRWPRLTYFSLTAQSTEAFKFRFKQEQSSLLVGNYLDLEDLVILKSEGDKVSEFIFTSEELFSPNVFSTLENASTENPPNSYIFTTSALGQHNRDIQIPTIYYSHSLELDTLCGKKEDGLAGFFIKLFNIGNRREKLAALTEEQRNRCQQYEQNDGIRYNRGIESLAISHDKKFLYYTTEQAILFNGKLSEDLHLTRQNLELNTHEIFTYPYSPNSENGVVGLLYLGFDHLLALERGYDPKQREATVHVYKIKLVKSPALHVEKTLLFNMKDLLQKMPPGFRSVDNFEGIALGPEIDAKNFSIILVSDNNFSLRQKTDFVVVKIPNEWKGRQ